MNFKYQSKVKLIDSMGSDKRVVDAARVSFLKDDYLSSTLNDKDQKLIKYLACHHHTSPFEHTSATFLIETPIFVARQIMRHRTFSYNEVSRRYTSDSISIWLPSKLRGQAKINRQCSEGEIDQEEQSKVIIEKAMTYALSSYYTLIESGVSRELARTVLPQGTMTTFYMTGNLMNWIKFLKLRDHEGAQPETIEVAKSIKKSLLELFPISMNAYFKKSSAVNSSSMTS